MSTYDREYDPADFGPEPPHIANDTHKRKPMRQDVRTSDHWRVVRNFVKQVRTDAHELSVERSMMQEILQLCDHLGTEYVMDMIQHEKRVMETGDSAFWAAKDAQDERDYERTSTTPATNQTESGATNGI